jgi:hypothetical protein
MNQRIKTKYFNFIQDCYNHQTFDKLMLRDIHRVGFTLLRAMANTNNIQTTDGVTKWIGQPLTQHTVKEIYNEYNHLKKIEQRKRLKKKELKPNQMTITPIRKAPVDTPQPIVKEAECDTSNSKMLLILAVGAMVGFMIATIIWK